ncbi:HD domain-containing protein [Clostridium sp. ZS2-4]|uniref:HD domain-containing protein n=1 Tax=Clostridium sp. ZS2-4 TaxID=2987703 RepID=UPI00227A2E12|nr:HD domain-containing protein [Clostridium sp. ZS2-4]MCY6353675.1 HD domain-containing protein [Clostridium sp. ZS2-4]
MSLYRIKQFYWAVTSTISSKDKEFIREYLNQDEINLFAKLAVYDQRHSIKIAQDVKKIYSTNERLIKAALLHDIGKISKPLNLLERSLMVILDNLFKDKMKRYENIKIIDSYYNHGENGYKILKGYGYNERLLYLVKNHHNNDIIGDKELNILKQYDNQN